MSDQERLNNWFTYHPPIADQSQRYERLRAAGKVMAEQILAECPESRDRDEAVRKIREAVFLANASIACGGE